MVLGPEQAKLAKATGVKRADRGSVEVDSTLRSCRPSDSDHASINLDEFTKKILGIAGLLVQYQRCRSGNRFRTARNSWNSRGLPRWPRALACSSADEQWSDDPRRSCPGNPPARRPARQKTFSSGFGGQRMPTCLTCKVQRVQRSAIPDGTNDISPQPGGEPRMLVRKLGRGKHDHVVADHPFDIGLRSRWRYYGHIRWGAGGGAGIGLGTVLMILLMAYLAGGFR
jgi:hypothetical protein